MLSYKLSSIPSSAFLKFSQFKSSIANSPWYATVLLVSIFSLLHILTIGHIELTNDEAQYALYGYYLDWSYFDHPPLSGWLNALILPLSDSDFALRIFPVLLAALTSFILYGFTRDLYPDKSAWLGFIAVVFYQSSLISQVLGLAMLPDTPLIPISLTAFWLLFRVLHNHQDKLWLTVGLLFGLAGLAKYTAVTLVITAIFALILFKRYRTLLTPWPWLGMVIAALVISPVIFWNWQHDWISISYQLGHGAPLKSWHFSNLFISQFAQLISYSPAIYIFGLIAILHSFRHPHRSHQFILATVLPVLVLFGWNSGYEQSLPHWTVLGWVALAPLSANWLVEHWDQVLVRVFTYLSSAYSLVMLLGLHFLLSTSLLPFESNQHPLQDIYGWKKVAHRAVELQQQMKTEKPDKDLSIFVGNWSQFSRLAWYAKPHPVQVTDQRYGQSDIWYGSVRAGASGILVVPPKYKDAKTENGKQKFEHCLFIENVSAEIANKIAATYQIYKCDNYKG